MAYSEPATGEPVIKYVSNKSLWKDIVAMLSWWEATHGKLALVIGNYGDVVPIGLNTTKTLFKPGELAQIGGPVARSFLSRPIEHYKNAPILKIENPVWPTSLDQLVIINKVLMPNLSVPIIKPTLFAVPGTMVLDTDRYAMMDPQYPRKVRTADAGIFKIVAYLSDDNGSYLILDSRQSQPIWQFRTVEDGSTSAALHRLDGYSYSDSYPVTITFPFGHTNAGFCLQVGSTFTCLNSPTEQLEKFLMLSNWSGVNAAARFTYIDAVSPHSVGIVEDKLGIFADQLSYGKVGLCVKTATGRHHVIQAKCNQATVAPPTLGCCVIPRSPGLGGDVSTQTTNAICTELGGTWTSGACP
jgi:hypothetical protein